MVDRLARFLDAGVVVLGADGEPEIVAGRRRSPSCCSEVCAQPPGLVELEAGGWHAVATPIARAPTRRERWLVLASPRPASSASSRSPPPRRPRRCSLRWRGSATSCASRSRP